MRDIDRREFVKYGGSVATGTALAGCVGEDNGDGGNGGETDGTDGNGGETDDTDDNSETNQETETITLAGTLPLTGADASTGQNVLMGYEAVVQRINEAGGVEVGDTTYEFDLDIRDDATDPDRAAPIYEEFITDAGYDFFLGSFGSATVLPTAAITDRNDKIMVQAGGGSDEIFTQGWDNVFGIFPRASDQFNSSRAMIEELDPQPESFTIVYTNDPFSQFQAEGAMEELEGAGYDIVGEHEIPREATDVSGVMSSIADEDPDFLITTTHDAESRLLMREISTRNIDVDAVYQTLGPNQPGYREDLGDASEYVWTQTYWNRRADYQDPLFDTAQGFLDYVVNNFDVAEDEFEYHTASGGACILVYYYALQRAGTTDIDAIAEEIHSMDLSDDESFYGPIEFREEGDGDPIKLGPLLQQVQDGTMEIIFPDDAATSDVVWPMPSWDER